MPLSVTSEALTESKTFRDQGISEVRSYQGEEVVLKRVKALLFATWKGIGWATTQQVADFYMVPETTIVSNYGEHRDEFESDGAQILEGKELQDVKRVTRLTSELSPKAPKVTIYTPAAVLRMGMILRDSEVAKQVRTATIDAIKGGGLQVDSSIILQGLTEAYPLLDQFCQGACLEIATPVASFWSKAISRQYPGKQGIPGMTADDLKQQISDLSPYVDFISLKTDRELAMELGQTALPRTPHLLSKPLAFETPSGAKSCAMIFQITELIVKPDFVRDIVSRSYIRVAFEHFEKLGTPVDDVFLFLVAPFGATEETEQYIRNYVDLEYRERVGVITVRDLTSLLYQQAMNERPNDNFHRGAVTEKFRKLRNYAFPSIPQMELDFSASTD